MTVRKLLFDSGLYSSLRPSNSSFRSERRERNGKEQGEKKRQSLPAQETNMKQTGMRCGGGQLGKRTRKFWHSSNNLLLLSERPQDSLPFTLVMEKYRCQSTKSSNVEKAAYQKEHPTFLESFMMDLLSWWCCGVFSVTAADTKHVTGSCFLSVRSLKCPDLIHSTGLTSLQSSRGRPPSDLRWQEEDHKGWWAWASLGRTGKRVLGWLQRYWKVRLFFK